MKSFLIIQIILFAFVFTVNAQTAEDYFRNGKAKQNINDLVGALMEYDKAILKNPLNDSAYLNKAICELLLRNFRAAINDLNKCIELDSNNSEAYFNRSAAYGNLRNYSSAFTDIEKAIKLDSLNGEYYFSRGEINMELGNKKDGCNDYSKAKTLGFNQFEDLVKKECENKNFESFSLYWPDEEKWKLGSRQENQKLALIELIHANETINNWTELGAMYSYKNVINSDLKSTMNLLFESTKKTSPNAKLTFIEIDQKCEYPWIIFTIECPNFIDDSKPESQLWYIVQGKSSLYSNFRAVKESSISSEQKSKWISFFKTGKVILE